MSEHTPVYSINIIDNGRVTLGVLCDECDGDDQQRAEPGSTRHQMGYHRAEPVQ